MGILENILTQQIVQKLGWTLLHSVWQGGVVVFLLVVCLRILQKYSANLRYVISCLGLAVIVLLPVVTFYLVPAPAPISDVESVTSSPAPVTEKLYKVYDADMPLQHAAEYMQISPVISWRQRAKNLCTYALPFVVFGWFIGVFALSLWHLGGWAHLHRLKRKNVNRVASSLKDKLHNLAGRLKVNRPVLLMESALVQIPTVVGWFRPVILLPASALSGLTPEQVEALLAHELAHIRRYDYLVNMFQTVVEILGFYHPAVWWISHKMRVERENCCDDLAVSVGGDKMAYARALTSMEEIRQAQGELVIAAGGGNLFTRISRLVGYESARKARHVWTPVVLSALLIIVLAIPATLVLTASGLRADSTTTHVSELADEENISSSSDRQSTSHLSDINSKTQILFDCKFFKVPADLEIIEGWPKPVDKQFIDVDRVYTDRLEELSQEREDVKLLVAPRMLAVNGKLATMSAPGAVLNVAGKVKDNAIKVNLSLKLKNDTVTSVVMSEPEETIIVGGLRDSNDLNQSIILTITPHIIASKELADTSTKVEQDRVNRPCVAADSAESGDLDETATKAQILFDCKIYEVPVDVKFLEGEQKEDKAGQMIWLGKEYADSLKALSRENEYVKVLAAPKIITLDGKEATVNTTQNVSYTADYETDKGDDKPKPIIKNLPCEMELKVKGEVAKNNTIFIHLRLTQSKPVFATKQNDEGREIQIPIIERSDCTTYLDTRSGESIILGGLRSDEGPSRNLILVITPSIIRPEKGPEKAKIEKEIRAVAYDPEHVVVFPETEKGNIIAETHRPEQDPVMLEQQARDLERKVAELYQLQKDIQRQLEDLEQRKAELESLSAVLALTKEAERGAEPRYHTVRPGETLSSISEKYYGSDNKWQEILNCNPEVKTSDGIRVGQKLIIPHLPASAKEQTSERKKAVIQAQIEALEAQLIELRKNYEAEIFNRQSEWWAEMRAFTADVVAAKKSIFDANSMLERDLAALNKIEKEIKNFRMENGANIATDIALHNKLKAMEANRDALQEQIERDKAVLDRCEKEFKDAQYRREAYMQYRPMAGTDPNEAQRVINLAKRALELQLYHLKGLSSEHTSPKEPKTEHERLAAMADRFAERGDFAKAIEHLEKAIELAKVQKDYGIGIAIEKVDGLIRISQLLPDAPASGSSFRQGDIIKAIDGVSTEGMSLNEVVARIRGPKGTKVTLTVKSHSQDITVEETFTRQLLLKGSPALQEYHWRLDAYEAGKTWPQYREMMKYYKPSSGEAVQVYKLKNADPEELAQLLNRILQRRWKDIKDKPKDNVIIVPDPGHKKLIILASPADIRLLEALIAELDVLAKQENTILKSLPDTEYKQMPAADSTITKVIKLKYADCKDLEQILLQILSDKRLRIATDKRTNMLIVTGNKSMIQEITDLVAELDIPSREDSAATKISPSSKLTPDTSTEDAFYEIIQLKHSDCKTVSEKVEKILSADQQFQLVPLRDVNQLIILGTMSAIQQVKALAKEIDVPGSKKELEIQF